MKELETIKRTLQKHLLSKMKVNDFVKTEMTLAVLEKYAPDSDAQQAYFLLHNYGLIGNIQNLQEIAFLQKAHICLRQCSSKQNWGKLFEQYRENIPENLRIYKITEETEKTKKVFKFSRNSKSTIAPERIEIYLDYIIHFQEKHHTHYAKAGNYQFWLESKETPWAEVKIPEHEPKMPRFPQPKAERKVISIAINELLASAEEMKKINPKDFCYSVLKENTIKTVKENQVIPATELTIQEVVNLVGMVGSGKSTLIKVLSYHLAKRNQKVVMVLDTIADTLQMYAYFKKIGFESYPFDWTK